MPSFQQIPADIRTPGAYTEFDPSQAVQGTPAKPHTALLIGLRLTGGSVAQNIPTQLIGKTDGDGYFGVGSQLAEMARAFKAANPRTKVLAIGVDENAAGVVATGTVTIAGTPTAKGTLAIYIGGTQVLVSVGTTDTPTTIAAALVAAINANTRLPVTAANAAGVVTLTARHKGPQGNDIVVEKNRRQGDALPAGVTATIVAMASGATAPDLTATIAALGDVQYDTIAIGFNDSTNLALIEAELLRRWGPLVQLEGHCFVSYRGTSATTITYASSRNSPFVTIVPTGKCPTAPWIAAAVAGAVDAAEPDPGRPRHTLPLLGIEAPASSGDAFTRDERDLLLHSGVSTWKLDPAGLVIVERMITSYRKNALNVDDPTYLDITTMRVLAYLRWSWNLRIQIKYPRHKLVDDGTNFEPGAAVVTPSVIRGEALAWFREMERASHVEDFEQFKKDLKVERDANDPNRLNLVLVPNLVNGLGVIATQFAFRV